MELLQQSVQFRFGNNSPKAELWSMSAEALVQLQWPFLMFTSIYATSFKIVKLSSMMVLRYVRIVVWKTHSSPHTVFKHWKSQRPEALKSGFVSLQGKCFVDLAVDIELIYY